MNNCQVIELLLKNNKEWSEEMKNQHSEILESNGKGQSPVALWIGCADSRVPESVVTKQFPGVVFTHRNIANTVINNDDNLGSVLEYALIHLKIDTVVICGHYDCGGVKAALSDTQFTGSLSGWIQYIRDGFKNNPIKGFASNEQDNIEKHIEQHTHIQVEVLKQHRVVEELKKEGRDILIQGTIYDPATGELKLI